MGADVERVRRQDSAAIETVGQELFIAINLG